MIRLGFQPFTFEVPELLGGGTELGLIKTFPTR
jgi:hypothetical protein